MVKEVFHPCNKTYVLLQHNRGKHQEADPRKKSKLKIENETKHKKLSRK